MAEVLSITASVVSLVQVLELVRGSITIIRNIKDAPAEWQRISSNLEATQRIVVEIEKLLTENTPVSRTPSAGAYDLLHNQVRGLQESVDLLHRLTARRSIHDGSFARWKIRFKWVTGVQTRLLEVYGRLENSLLLTISLLTMYTTFEGRSTSQRIQQDLNALNQQLITRGSESLATSTIHRPLPIIAPRVVTSVHGSIMVCANLLEDISPSLRRLAAFKDGSSLGCRVRWLRSQIHGLLLDASSGWLEDDNIPVSFSSTSRAGRHQIQGSCPTISIRKQNTEHSPVSLLSKSTLYFFLKQFSVVNSVSAEFLGQDGIGDQKHDILVTLLSHQPPEASGNNTGIESFTRCRLYAAPCLSATQIQQSKGAVVQFFEVTGSQPQLWRSLTTFGVHPRKSPVFEYIRNGNLSGVQRLFSLGVLSPNDRDQEGNSLLWHCLESDDNYDMCELLLREGASPSDCNIRGDHALAVLVMHLSLRGKHLTNDTLKLLDLVLQYSEKYHNNSTGVVAEPTATLPYKSREGVHLAPAGIVHCATPRRADSGSWVAQLPTLLQRFGSHFGITGSLREGPYLPTNLARNTSCDASTYALDLELADRNGNTALLYTMFYHPTLVVLQTGTYLLDSGADIKAKNKFGEGALHLLCRRLSACSVPNLSKEVKKGVVSLMCRLIKGGCDPVEANQVGFTPIDAAMTPVAWPLFCSALKEVGKDVKAELDFLDIASGVIWCEAELETLVEEKVAEFVASQKSGELEVLKRYPSEEERATDGVLPPRSCYLCGGEADQFKRQAPFDEFYSDVVNELGHGVHMVKYHHEDLGDCLLVGDEDSCYPLDYDPTRPGKCGVEKLRERSWRRHVAACLWERGLLD